MAGIKGIFEPFQKYVTKQLDIRKEILSNTKGKNITSYKRYEQNPELFHTYAHEKQCVIRMMSGVDIRTDEVDPSLFEIDPNRPKDAHVSYDETYLRWKPSGLARQYILEGGTRYYNDKIEHGWRGGFTTGKREDDMVKAFSYGDKNVRADAGDGFGVVPMPGITDASIQTKSDNGALREAQVNFVCFNRRQLEVLEMLYMRPGYPVALEWGWNPYISNDKTREPFDYTIKNDFFKESSSLDKLNRKIRNYKKKSSGNYDGFIGYIKNFTFKAREDGGYDCTTEIMAHGEILETLKSPVRKLHKVLPNAEDPVVEYEDRLLFYFRALKHQLNSKGSQFYLSQFIEDTAVKEGSLMYYEGYNTIKGRVPTVPEEYTGESLKEKQQAINDFQNNYNQENKLDEIDAGGFTAAAVDNTRVNVPDILSQFSEEEQEKLEEAIKSGQVERDELIKKLEESEGWEEMMDILEKDVGARATQNVIDDENIKARAWNEYLKIKSQELDLKTPIEYKIGLSDIKSLHKYINKEASGDIQDGLFDEISGKGFESMLGGAILKQTMQYNPYSEREEISNTVRKRKQGRWGQYWEDETTSYTQTTEYDSGLRRNIFVRWDLVCQMINHLANSSSDEVTSKLDLIFNYNNQNKGTVKNALVEPQTEITYMNPNQRTWNNRRPEKGKTKLYDSNKDGIMENNTLNGGNYIPYSPCTNTLSDPMLKVNPDTGEPNKPQELLGKYHPIIGNSFDERICLMPHQAIFDSMFEEGTVAYEDNRPDPTGEEDANVQEIVEEEVNLRTISSYQSTNKAKNMRNSIGFVYFNLNFLLDTYESLRIKSASLDMRGGGTSKYNTLNRDFSLFDFISAIWEGVNDACGGYYNFQIHTEHERPGVARIIDMRLSTTPDDIFSFDPQGLKAVTRQFYFDSTIDANMASAISIAAQAPNSEQSLESLSFKAFHKNIKSRFLRKDFASSFDTDTHAALKKQELADDIREFTEAFSNLTFYLRKLHNHTFQSEFRVLQPQEAIKQAGTFMELRQSILHRYPLFYPNGDDHKFAGQWRKNTTTDSNAIIPLQCSLQLDGISGIIPLQLFRIAKDKLPFGYQREDIVFVVKSESHKLSNTQDWIVEITAQMALLNNNPNNSGTNNILEYLTPPLLLEALEDPGYTTKWADYLRDIMDQFGHTEKSYVDNIDKEASYGSPFLSGELSSHDDITPSTAAITEIMLRCMEDEQWCNEHLYGDNPDDHVYTVDGILSSVKLIFTGGNDKEHQKPDFYCKDGKNIDGSDCPDYNGSKHRTGEGIDFVIMDNGDGSVPFEVKRALNGEEYSILENINYNYMELPEGGTGIIDFKSPNSIGSQFFLYGGRNDESKADIRSQYENFKSIGYRKDTYSSYTMTTTTHTPTNYENKMYDMKGTQTLNALVVLCAHIHFKYPNFWFIDEYRTPSGRATGPHFHIYERTGPSVPLDQAALLHNKIQILG